MQGAHNQECTECQPPSKLRKISSNQEEFNLREKTISGEHGTSLTRDLQNTFESLPDEVIMKIFRMVIDGKMPLRFSPFKTCLNLFAMKTQGRELKCEYCEFRVQSNSYHKRRNLRNHVKRKHENAVMHEGEYEMCPVTRTCNYFSQDAMSMRAHLRANHLGIGDHNYIVDVLGNVCSRFRRITGDKTFWRDGIKIALSSQFGKDEPGNKSRFQRILNSYLGQFVKDLDITEKNVKAWKHTNAQTKKHQLLLNRFYGSSVQTNLANKVAMSAIEAKYDLSMHLSKKDISALSSKCPNLVLLRFHAIQLTGWPTEHNYWHSLDKLSLSFTTSPNIFRDIQLHRTLPNLRQLRITEDGCPPIMLPDMTQCHKLTLVEIIGGGHQSFCFQCSFRERVPFPTSLERLSISMVEFVQGGDRLNTMEVLTAVKKHSTKCKVQYEFYQDMTTICSGML